MPNIPFDGDESGSTLEAMFSTKMVEMGAAGLPVILNPYKVHTLLLPADYPLWWDQTRARDSFVEVLEKLAAEKPGVYAAASQVMLDFAERFTMANIVPKWQQAIELTAKVENEKI